VTDDDRCNGEMACTARNINYLPAIESEWAFRVKATHGWIGESGNRCKAGPCLPPRVASFAKVQMRDMGEERVREARRGGME
jgi:hypothetical protein